MHILSISIGVVAGSNIGRRCSRRSRRSRRSRQSVFGTGICLIVGQDGREIASQGTGGGGGGGVVSGNYTTGSRIFVFSLLKHHSMQGFGDRGTDQRTR